MIKNYNILIFFVLCFIFGITNLLKVSAQEVKVFKTEDFDLNGPVKSCWVATDYGKEEYDFNENGFLIKAVTRYSETDYDITRYQLKGNTLLDKRVETYRDGIFMKNTSIANIYTLDTTQGRKITENIISYSKEFLDQYEYFYNQDGKLSYIKRTNDSGIDVTSIKYDSYKGEVTETYYLNDIIFKSVRTSKIKKNNTIQKLILTKEYLEGKPQLALEQVYDANDKLVSEKRFLFNTNQKTFTLDQSTNYTYNDKGTLTNVVTLKDHKVSKHAYIYQYDHNEPSNWVKQIITPENTYKTRKITYHPNVNEGKS